MKCFFMIRKTAEKQLEITMECTEEEFSEMLISFLISDDGEKYFQAIKRIFEVKSNTINTLN